LLIRRDTSLIAPGQLGLIQSPVSAAEQAFVVFILL
jgi:hypothetical protein